MPDERRGCEDLEQGIPDGEIDESLMQAVAHCLAEDVKRFARARCGDQRGDAEDIAQDALLAAQRYLSTFRGEASLKTWLYRLVLSACSRHRRGRKNDLSLHQPLADELELADPANPELVLLVSERLGALEQAMSELRGEDRALLADAEWEGLSLEQLAARHGLTVSAVKSRLFRIRRELRARVTGAGERA